MSRCGLLSDRFLTLRFCGWENEDRCHRIGQTKKVTVYKLVTQGTVDEDIYNMQERKAKMNAAIMESKDERQERKAMLKAAVTRFMESPRKEIIII